jgi:hypothetical protein
MFARSPLPTKMHSLLFVAERKHYSSVWKRNRRLSRPLIDESTSKGSRRSTRSGTHPVGSSIPFFLPISPNSFLLSLSRVILGDDGLPKAQSHPDSRSDLELGVIHTGIWQKKGMQEPDLTSETRAGSAEAREATTFVFLRVIREIANLFFRSCVRS